MKKLVSFFGEHSEIFDNLNRQTSEYAKSKGIEYIWAPQNPFNQTEVISYLKNADFGLIDVEPYGEDIFSKIHERCKLLIRFGVGFDKVDLKAATKYGICITRTTEANSMSVADMALSMILAIRRQHAENRTAVNSGVWVKNIGTETYGKTIGIVGFGATGQRLAQLLKGFKCKILVYEPYPDEEALKEAEAELVSLEEIFSTSDAISIHVPYLPATHHLVDSKMLSLMKPTAALVCTARGNIVDEDALYKVLSEKKIMGAGLDVFSTEPLPKESPLTGLQNIILTPHVASQTLDALSAIYTKAIDIAADFIAGRTISKNDLLNPDYNEAAK